ncbi:MAG: hypothetical protein QNJ12_02040 [Ilumatobacter sp.]|uniref:hypothetical protein n=1 Tax=Ilumatobacter sp. TaxID=1967498 RepID=UPI0026210F39|nr:hypothetical protein [Ilumatobacter sp.]MDJ0767536.1 hypothetical protein [Ilumatobacter sp.]
MNDETALVAGGGIGSVERSDAGEGTSEDVPAVVDGSREWSTSVSGRLVARLRPPLCSMHGHTPLRRMPP